MDPPGKVPIPLNTSEYSFSKYPLVVCNRCVFPPMVIFLSVHSSATGITGFAGGFAGLSVMVFMDVFTLALTVPLAAGSMGS